MTTLKDKIRDALIDFQKELLENNELTYEEALDNIMDEISDEFRGFLDKTLN